MLRVMLKSTVFNISIYNRNVLILVKMRGHLAYDDGYSRDMVFSPIFSHFSHFLAKNG